MSRHRNVRKLDYAEECDFDDVYGRSAEEDFCISPTTAAEYMYDRGAKSHDISSFLDERSDILEEATESEELLASVDDLHLTEENQARLLSCLNYLRDIVGHNFDEQILRAAIIKNDFDGENALKCILENHSTKEAPKPQRAPRRDRRNIADDILSSISSSNTAKGENIALASLADIDIDKFLSSTVKIQNDTSLNYSKRAGSKAATSGGKDLNLKSVNAFDFDGGLFKSVPKQETKNHHNGSKNVPESESSLVSNGKKFDFNFKPFFDASKNKMNRNAAVQLPTSSVTFAQLAKQNEANTRTKLKMEDKKNAVNGKTNARGPCLDLGKFLTSKNTVLSSKPEKKLAAKLNVSALKTDDLKRSNLHPLLRKVDTDKISNLNNSTTNENSLVNAQMACNADQHHASNSMLITSSLKKIPESKENGLKFSGCQSELHENLQFPRPPCNTVSDASVRSVDLLKNKLKDITLDELLSVNKWTEKEHANERIDFPKRSAVMKERTASENFSKVFKSNNTKANNIVRELDGAYSGSATALKASLLKLQSAVENRSCSAIQTVPNVDEAHFKNKDKMHDNQKEKTKRKNEEYKGMLPDVLTKQTCNSKSSVHLLSHPENSFNKLAKKLPVSTDNTQKPKSLMFSAVLCMRLKPVAAKCSAIASIPSNPYAYVNGCGDLTPFNFQTPSPDDIALAAKETTATSS